MLLGAVIVDPTAEPKFKYLAGQSDLRMCAAFKVNYVTFWVEAPDCKGLQPSLVSVKSI